MLNGFKKNIMILIIWLMIVLVIGIFSTLMALFGVVDISNPQKSIFIFITGVVSFMILGFLSGNIRKDKGLLNGIIFSFVVLVIFTLLNYLGYQEKISLDILAKYAVLILSGGLGGIFGVNFKPVIK